MSRAHESSGSPAISVLCQNCLGGYSTLCEGLDASTPEHAVGIGFDRNASHDLMRDARSRFKAWAVSIAALQKGHLQSSLDFRLKEATEIRRRIVKILTDLNQSLHEAFSIVNGSKPNEKWEVGAISDSDDDINDPTTEEASETSELEQLFLAIKTANSSLMKLSMVIRNSPARDDYLKASSRYNFDARYDIGHVKEKHGAAKRSSDWLLERLGKAITRRRQYLKYREDHHTKLSRDWGEAQEAVVAKDEDVGNDEKPEKTIALTKATTYVENKVLIERDGTDGPDLEGSFGSQTSYEPTVVSEAVNKLTVPPPPIIAFEGVSFEYGEPFQCPYCYTEQTVKNKTAWKKHVFGDLKSYVCTFKECNLRMFRSRNEWFAHELQNHRREWVCPSCLDSFTDKDKFSAHLQSMHRSMVFGSQLEALILQSEEPVDKIPASGCLLCDEWELNLLDPKQDSKRLFLNKGEIVEPCGTLGQFRRHLGRHMEQLALFALPMAEEDEMEDDSLGEESHDLHSDDDDEDVESDPKTKDTLAKPSNSIDEDTPKESYPNRILFVENVDVSVQLGDLENLLKPFGELEIIEWYYEIRDGTSKTAEVRFYSGDCAHKAMEKLNRYELAGRRLNLSLQPPRIPGTIHGNGSDDSGSEDVEPLSTPIIGHSNRISEEQFVKCPIQTCSYHIKGFARTYDMNRHLLTHYRRNLVCGFCPGSGTFAEKFFIRVDTFKKHLTSVHGVEPTPYNGRKIPIPIKSTENLLGNYCPDATGKCSVCSGKFSNAEDLYEHLDDCVVRALTQAGVELSQPTSTLEDDVNRNRSQSSEVDTLANVDDEPSSKGKGRSSLEEDIVKYVSAAAATGVNYTTLAEDAQKELESMEKSSKNPDSLSPSSQAQPPYPSSQNPQLPSTSEPQEGPSHLLHRSRAGNSGDISTPLPELDVLNPATVELEKQERHLSEGAWRRPSGGPSPPRDDIPLAARKSRDENVDALKEENTTVRLIDEPGGFAVESEAQTKSSFDSSQRLFQQQATIANVARRIVLHLLAVEPMSEEALISKLPSNPNLTQQEAKQALQRVGDLNERTGKWNLKKHFYQKLDVWAYDYNPVGDRQRAIDNAVRQYDRMRVGVSEPEWDRLLVPAERGTGKCLSKLAPRRNEPELSIPTTEYTEFIQKLAEYHKKRGTPFETEPLVGGKHIDLLRLFKAVVEHGGYDKVSDEELAWRKLAQDFNLGTNNLPALAFSLKTTYYKNLAAYEISTIHGKEPPPKEILEDKTAKGGGLLSRTLENDISVVPTRPRANSSSTTPYYGPPLSASAFYQQQPTITPTYPPLSDLFRPPTNSRPLSERFEPIARRSSDFEQMSTQSMTKTQEDYAAMPPPPTRRPSYLRRTTAEYRTPTEYTIVNETSREGRTQYRTRRQPPRTSSNPRSTYDLPKEGDNVMVGAASSSSRRLSWSEQAAAAYQEDVVEPTAPLTAESLRRVRRRQVGGSRSTKSSQGQDESSGNDDENVTIKVTGPGRITVGGTQIDCDDGGEIEIKRLRSPRKRSEQKNADDGGEI